jgi:hypothetical protein
VYKDWHFFFHTACSFSSLELGLTPDAFRLIQEIDILVLKGNSIQSAIEVTTTISTCNKAVNDRFRNLLSIVPNLKIKLNVVLRDIDRSKTSSELHTPANIEAKLTEKVSPYSIYRPMVGKALV